MHGVKAGPMYVCPGIHESLGPFCAAMCTEKVRAAWVLFGSRKLRNILVLQIVNIERKLCGWVFGFRETFCTGKSEIKFL